MDTGCVDADGCSSPARGHAEAGIIFGSVAPDPTMARASVRATCEAIGLPRSTYYYQSHRSASAVELEQKIVLRLHELREQYPKDGYRRMTLHLQLEGFHVNRKRIARLMQLHGLTANLAKPANDTVRNMLPRAAIRALGVSGRPTGPPQAWLSDVAYIHLRSGMVYAAVVIDVRAREIVGFALSHQINKHLVSMALHSAIRARRPAFGCVHHSTCGTQYLMRGCRDLLRQYGLIPSAGSAIGQSAPLSRIVEVQAYGTWKDVIEQPREFIRAVYSRERIDWVLDGLSLAETHAGVPTNSMPLSLGSRVRRELPSAPGR